MINITPAALNKMSELLLEDKTMPIIRAYVSGGGCSGFQYGFTFDDNENEDDIEVSKNPKVLVDVMSMQYLDGATFDYVNENLNSQFVINNPNVKSQCGCGSSFSV